MRNQASADSIGKLSMPDYFLIDLLRKGGMQESIFFLAAPFQS